MAYIRASQGKLGGKQVLPQSEAAQGGKEVSWTEERLLAERRWGQGTACPQLSHHALLRWPHHIHSGTNSENLSHVFNLEATS